MTDPAVQSDTPGPADTTVPRPFHRHPGDGWVQCAHGHRHWGLHGAAGLLLARRAHQGAIDAVACGDYRAHGIIAGGEGEFGLTGIAAAAHGFLGKRDAGCLHAQQDLVGAGDGLGNLAKLQAGWLDNSGEDDFSGEVHSHGYSFHVE